MKHIKYHYNSLHDFVIANELTSDGWINDGGEMLFPVKGREIIATVLFADMAGFSRRSLELNPTETLILLNHFITWMTADALQNTSGIIDKYIGDEMMIVFSEEFGAQCPFDEALKVAKDMAEGDFYGFSPHIGIASGQVTVGFTGTPIKYDCTVVGKPVALAKRCADLKVPEACSTSIVFPSEEWGTRQFDKVFPLHTLVGPNREPCKMPSQWKMLDEISEDLKNMGETSVRRIISLVGNYPMETPEERAKAALKCLKDANRYWPDERYSSDKSSTE